MLINFDEEKISKEIVEFLTTEDDVYEEDIIDEAFERIENWFADQGLMTIVYEIVVEKLTEMNIEIKI